MPDSDAQKYCCIDVGTNSIKLLIADLSQEPPEAIFEASETTRLGEGIRLNHGLMQSGPMERTLDGLTRLMEASRDIPVRGMAAVGTAALRDALNSGDFISAARERLGINIEIISGEEEARLSFLAVCRDSRLCKGGRLIVMDVGGGSTELIVGDASLEKIDSRYSVNLGSVKVTEQYLPSDPVNDAELVEAKAAAAAAFDLAPLNIKDSEEDDPLVGVGGTLTTLAGMSLANTGNWGRTMIHGFRLDTPTLEAHIARLASKTVLERHEIEGLDPRRADIILGGALIVYYAMRKLNRSSVRVSTRGLRWGVLYDKFGSRQASGVPVAIEQAYPE